MTVKVEMDLGGKETIEVLFTEDEYSDICLAAEKLGTSVAEFIKYATSHTAGVFISNFYTNEPGVSK